MIAARQAASRPTLPRPRKAERRHGRRSLDHDVSVNVTIQGGRDVNFPHTSRRQGIRPGSMDLLPAPRFATVVNAGMWHVIRRSKTCVKATKPLGAPASRRLQTLGSRCQHGVEPGGDVLHLDDDGAERRGAS